MKKNTFFIIIAKFPCFHVLVPELAIIHQKFTITGYTINVDCVQSSLTVQVFMTMARGCLSPENLVGLNGNLQTGKLLFINVAIMLSLLNGSIQPFNGRT